jgi:hypothetical protein
MSLPRVALAALLVAAAATAAILLNLLLLNHAAAQTDPIGSLTPRANLPAAPQWTVRPERDRSGRERSDGSDD